MTGRQWIEKIASLCRDLDAELPVTLLTRNEVGGIESRTTPGDYIAYPTWSGTQIYVELKRN
jgi:hypothetical protein